LKNKKNELSKQIEKYKKEGMLHKERRDEINKLVAKSKEKRKKLNEEYEKIRREINKIRREYFPNQPPLEVLKQKRDALEFKQMTQQLSKREEEELIQQLAGLNKEIKEREKILEKDERLREYMEKEKELKRKSDKEHEKVQELAERAQREHLEMIECLKKLRKLKKEFKKIEREYIMSKINADKAHREFVSYIQQIREIENKMKTIKEKEKMEKIEKERSVLQKKADEIYERFKRGEKLSTEDLMLLQKAGLI